MSNDGDPGLILPKFSIITATYNAADTLTICLDSVSDQSIDAVSYTHLRDHETF